MRTAGRLFNSLQYRAKKWRDAILKTLQTTRYSTLIERLHSAPDFPSVAASQKQLIQIMFEGSNRTLVELNRLCGVQPLKIANYNVKNNKELIRFSERLKFLFDKEGSDKGSGHEYHLLYADILWNQEALKILEIGLGTNRTTTPSNMGMHGKPGASLRVWQHFTEVQVVIGLDIDKAVLFSEGKIKTFELDQTDRNSWKRFKQLCPENGFDLIIDDGLHSPLANLVTISECLEMLKVGGYLVIEDIPTRSLPVWEMYLDRIPEYLEAEVFKFRKAYLLRIQRKPLKSSTLT